MVMVHGLWSMAYGLWFMVWDVGLRAREARGNARVREEEGTTRKPLVSDQSRGVWLKGAAKGSVDLQVLVRVRVSVSASVVVRVRVFSINFSRIGRVEFYCDPRLQALSLSVEV